MDNNDCNDCVENFRNCFIKMDNNEKTYMACALFKHLIKNPRCHKKETFANWYKKEYEITGDKYDILKVKDMFDLYKNSEDYRNMKKEDRPNITKFLLHTVFNDSHLNSIYKADHRSTINGERKQIRRVFIGIRLKHTEDDLLDN
jgi:hypothetical protein